VNLFVIFVDCFLWVNCANLTILGSTGSIGTSTLDVVARHPGKFQIVALTANCQVDLLFRQCVQFKPRYAVLLDENAATQLRQRVSEAGLAVEVLSGTAALEQVSVLPETDMVMAAIVGAAGLRPTLAAARAGKKILLANKETLVMAGNVFMDAVRASGSVLLPIDSEHNAIFQALPRGYDGNLAGNGVRRILLTASGGPFRNTPLEELQHVTPEQACAHPNWVMGRKISVDSASMMNKGLEVIEAHWLFNASADDIQVVVHPQSVIHSLVEYVDGSVLAQLGNPDMRIPIAYGLAWPSVSIPAWRRWTCSRWRRWISPRPTSRVSPVWPWPIRHCVRQAPPCDIECSERGGGGGFSR